MVKQPRTRASNLAEHQELIRDQYAAGRRAVSWRMRLHGLREDGRTLCGRSIPMPLGHNDCVAFWDTFDHTHRASACRRCRAWFKPGLKGGPV